VSAASIIAPWERLEERPYRRKDGTLTTVHARRRYLPEGWGAGYLVLDWPVVAACIVSPGATVEGRHFPKGSVVIVDADFIRSPAAVVTFARGNHLPPAGFTTRPLPALAGLAHVVVPRGLSQAAQERAGAMLAAAGTSAAGLYVSEPCASLLEPPSPLLGLAVHVAR
jgi:hypothetical protein